MMNTRLIPDLCSCMLRQTGLTLQILLVGCVPVLSVGPVVIAQDADADVDSDADTAVSDSKSDGVVFARMSVDRIRSELQTWLSATSLDEEPQQQELQKWSDSGNLSGRTGEELLDLVMESFAAADPAARRLLEESFGSGPVESVIFDGIREVPFFRNQVQLFRARWLAQHRFYDDALPILTELKPDDVVDPAGLLFYRAICQSELLQRRAALDSLALLLHNTLEVPARFRIVAEMLEQDLAARKDDGMERVAHLMKDVERLLELGESGEKTQGQEDAVIAALDKMLEEMDQENQQQNGGGGSSSPQNQSGTQGAQQSQIKGSPADGEADRKELTEGGKWGMMDEKAEAKARELIRQKFPPNFLDQIGRYTRKIAEQKN